jgi:ferrous iron transport protein A
MSQLIPLKALRPGQVAVIRQMLGPAEQIRRLEELGLREGTRVEMVRSGSPCIVRSGAAKLCLRHDELLSLMLELRMTA